MFINYLILSSLKARPHWYFIQLIVDFFQGFLIQIQNINIQQKQPQQQHLHQQPQSIFTNPQIPKNRIDLHLKVVVYVDDSVYQFYSQGTKNHILRIFEKVLF